MYLVSLNLALDKFPRLLSLHELVPESGDVQEVGDGIPFATEFHLGVNFFNYEIFSVKFINVQDKNIGLLIAFNKDMLVTFCNTG